MGTSEETKRGRAQPHAQALYVGDLEPSVDESDLVAAFAGFGLAGPESVRLCRDRLTGTSLRYAYLNFPSNLHAATAKNAMNHSSLKGRPMRIMWPMRQPQLRMHGIGNLFVKNLEEWIGGSELEELFNEYGHVLSCKLALDENGKSKGFGFVQMNSKESARNAIVALHGKILNGGTKELYVVNFVKKIQRQALLPQGRKYTNLYINNLEPHFTDDLLRAKFSEFGKVCSAVVMKDEFGKSRGFGFVTFELLEQATKAIEALNGSILGTKTIYVGFAVKKAECVEPLKKHFSERNGVGHPKKVEGSNVYVKHLDESVDDKALEDIFSQYGQVVSAKVMRQLNGMSKGFGFVSFSSPDAARNAVAALHGAFFCGKLLYVAIAQHREEFRKQPTSYSYPSIYQTKNYAQVTCQGYQCLHPVPLYQYYRQQWASYPGYASFVSSQLQHSVSTVKSFSPLQFKLAAKVLDEEVKEAVQLTT